jgi:uncharacterized membrane protein
MALLDFWMDEQGLTSGIIQVVIPIVYIISIIAYVLSAVLINLPSSAADVSALISQITPVVSVASIFLIVGGIVGNVLFYSSLTQLGKHYQNPQMTKNVTNGFILFMIVSVVSVLSAIIPSTLLSIANGHISSSSFFSVFSWIISSVAGYYYMQAFNKLAQNSQESKFKTSGSLVFIGNLTSIIGIGGILTWIGWIFAAMAFHNQKKPFSGLSPSKNMPTNKRKHGAHTEKNSACTAEPKTPKQAFYCTRCGKQIEI